jgi:hypothetical protein
LPVASSVFGHVFDDDGTLIRVDFHVETGAMAAIRLLILMSDLKVGRHDLLKMRMPDYAYPARESPVHNERCTRFLAGP